MLTLLTFTLLACTEDATPERIEPTFLYVELLDGETGTEAEPLPFTTELVSHRFRVTALDVNAEPTPFSGDITARVRPGRLEMSPWITVEDGVWEGEVLTRNSFGPTRIWFSDEGDKESDSARAPSFATGVGDPIYYALPTLGEMNDVVDHETNNLAGEFAELRTEDRDVRVLAVGTAGYWITDLADPPGSHNYLFVYTFSRPADEIEVGRRLSRLTGATQEYLATTQLSFPHYEVAEDEVVEMPSPAVLDGGRCEDNDLLEGYESAVVTLENVAVPDTFTSGNEDYEDYVAYGQWPIQAEGERCSYYVNTAVSVPDYVPTAGAEFASITGTLTEIWGQWILNPSGAEDLVTGAGGPPVPPSFRGGGMSQPRPRPRPPQPSQKVQPNSGP